MRKTKKTEIEAAESRLLEYITTLDDRLYVVARTLKEVEFRLGWVQQETYARGFRAGEASAKSRKKKKAKA